MVFDPPRVGACKDSKNGRIAAWGVTAPKGFRDWSLFPLGRLGVFRPFFPSLSEVKSYTGAVPGCGLGGSGRDISYGFLYSGLPGRPAEC